MSIKVLNINIFTIMTVVYIYCLILLFQCVAREHSECPVTACGCHCMKLDSVAMATPADSVDSNSSLAPISKEKQNIT